MKTKFITSVIAIIFASASLFAADSAATVELLNQKGSSIYKVVYKALGTGKAVLKISGTDGLVFSEIVTYTNGFAYPIDFKGMAEGEYTVEVLAKGTKFKQTVDFHVEKTIVPAPKEILDLKPKKPVAYVLTKELPNKKELLTITTQVPTDFAINIYDKWNHEVYSVIEHVDGAYGVLINVNNLERGYSIKITETGGNVNVIRK